MRYYFYFIEEKTEDRKLGIFSRIMQFLMKKWDLSTFPSDFLASIFLYQAHKNTLQYRFN